MLKFDNPQNGGRWKPNDFTKLLIPADLRNKMFVSRQPPVGYGAVLVGIYRLRIPARCCLLIGVFAPVTAVLNFARPAQSGQPIPATLTLYDPSKQSTAPIAGKERPLAADLRAPFGYTSLRPSWAFWECFVLKSIFRKRASSWSNRTIPKKIPIVFVHGQMAVPYMWLPVMAARCSAAWEQSSRARGRL